MASPKSVSAESTIDEPFAASEVVEHRRMGYPNFGRDLLQADGARPRVNQALFRRAQNRVARVASRAALSFVSHRPASSRASDLPY
jgi:hypothetical protein